VLPPSNRAPGCRAGGSWTRSLRIASDGSPRYERWRWRSWEPNRIEWVIAVVLFGGTLVFGRNLIDEFSPENPAMLAA
jgi:hypothetical protein